MIINIMIDDLNNLSNCNQDENIENIYNNSFNEIKKSFIHDAQATKMQKSNDSDDRLCSFNDKPIA